MQNTNFKPKSLNDFVFSNPNTERTLRAILEKKIPFPHQGNNGILLYGAPGTGKTTLASLLPTLLEQAHGGDSPTWEYVSCEQGKSGALLMPRLNALLNSYYGWNAFNCTSIVLDEVDNLSAEAQKSLKAVMNRKNSAFILTTNFISEIDNAIKDRCHTLDMDAPPAAQLLSHLRRLATEHSWMNATDYELMQIGTLSSGSYRYMARKVQEGALNQQLSVLA